MKSLIKVIVSIMLCSLLITACAGSAKNESESGASSEATSVSEEETKKEKEMEEKGQKEI